jgi:hypothetical protein
MPVTSTGGSSAHALHVAMHARRLAQQHVHRHVDREVFLQRGVHMASTSWSCFSSVAIPTTANGERSRSHMEARQVFGAIAST